MSQIGTTKLFIGSCWEADLLEEVFDAVPSEKKFASVIEVILNAPFKQYYKSEVATALLGLLSRIYGEDQVSFRKKLSEIYAKLMQLQPGTSRNYVDLELCVLREILTGWHPEKSDAEDCFVFVCGAYWQGISLVSLSGSQKAIADLFSKRLKSTGRDFSIHEMTPWIIREDTPEEIAKVLMHWRLNVNWFDDDSAERGIAVTIGELRQLHLDSQED